MTIERHDARDLAFILQDEETGIAIRVTRGAAEGAESFARRDLEQIATQARERALGVDDAVANQRAKIVAFLRRQAVESAGTGELIFRVAADMVEKRIYENP